jgi:hypothetical protein
MLHFTSSARTAVSRHPIRQTHPHHCRNTRQFNKKGSHQAAAFGPV